MVARHRISVPDADFLVKLPLERMLFYGSLLSGIGDKAADIRYVGSPEDALGKVLLNVDGNVFEIVPTSRGEAEKEIRSLLHPLDRWITRPICAWFTHGFYEVHLMVEAKGKATDVLVSVRPEALSIRFLNPQTASHEAGELAQEFRELAKVVFRHE